VQDKNFSSSDFRLGILGGGQLGKMLIAEAIKLDVHTRVLDPEPASPCRFIASYFETGNLMDYKSVYRFGKVCDLVTIEIEQVNLQALAQLESEGIKVCPSSASLSIIQDKYLQKCFYRDHQIPTADFYFLAAGDLPDLKKLNFPFVQKLCTSGYDGKGVQVVKGPEDMAKMFPTDSIIEQFIPEVTEISVIVARNASQEIKCFPAVEMVFHPEANLVEYLFCPARISPEQEQKARELAIQVISELKMEGLLAVEMFLTKEGDILINESAPRPHNSGHHTIESAFVSQYQQHLRAILDLPLGTTRMKTASVMINLLGEPGYSGKVKYSGLEAVMKMEGVSVHIYGKKETRPFRKMGHVTILSDTVENAREKADFVKNTLKVIA
jgi:5-(carboxyamino)imidazole ribonucleotide synthase